MIDEDFFDVELKLKVGIVLIVKLKSGYYKDDDTLLILEVLSSLFSAETGLEYTFIRCLNSMGRVIVTRTDLNIHTSRYKILQ